MRWASWLTACVLLLMLGAPGAVGQDQGKRDDEKKFTSAPEGFDAKRDSIERGKLETVEYDSKTVVEKTYSVKADREARALAGLSMGGGQALNFGLNNLDTFAWVGGFSSAPNTKPPANLIKDHAEAARKLRLLYVSCGDKDGLLRIS